MYNLFEKIFNVTYLFATILLISISVFTMGWSVWEVFFNFDFDENGTPKILQSVGAIVIAIAILDVAKYMCK